MHFIESGWMALDVRQRVGVKKYIQHDVPRLSKSQLSKQKEHQFIALTIDHMNMNQFVKR